jgi:hypothetical protein
VDVGVMLEVLAPGVEDGEKADLGPEVLGVGGDLLQGLGGGAEEQAVATARGLQGDRVERRWRSGDEVEILDGEEFRLAGLHPFGGVVGLELGAMAVAAGVVGYLSVPAPVALLDVSAQLGGPAGGDVVRDAPLPLGEPTAVPFEEWAGLPPEDVGHFDPGPGHSRISPGGRRGGRAGCGWPRRRGVRSGCRGRWS